MRCLCTSILMSSSTRTLRASRGCRLFAFSSTASSRRSFQAPTLRKSSRLLNRFCKKQQMQRLKEALPSIAATSAYIFVAARVGLFGKDDVHVTADEKIGNYGS